MGKIIPLPVRTQSQEEIDKQKKNAQPANPEKPEDSESAQT
jgi:hypothetical protein